jgi:DNA replication protein DnaC
MSRTASELAHLFRALKVPAAARALPVLAERAREEQWSCERFAEALLSTEVSSRDSHGGEGRIKAARFPARKTLEEFDFTLPTQRQEDRCRASRPARLPARTRELSPCAARGSPSAVADLTPKTH